MDIGKVPTPSRRRRRRRSPTGCNSSPVALRFFPLEREDLDQLAEQLGATPATIARECVLKCYPELGKRA
ncbi:hypothetical protein GCM10007907_20800 [Chitinimonas prasina]|uniref:DUF3606 domain-containing protein n=1 Tax=Chitinimonas prasina TaxID=1434937 RepID=A0ABQ5YEC6_9NEIS|nr:hypothetical protein GCM10007907_20800 [Chitinimonas prasina]